MKLRFLFSIRSQREKVSEVWQIVIPVRSESYKNTTWWPYKHRFRGRLLAGMLFISAEIPVKLLCVASTLFQSFSTVHKSRFQSIWLSYISLSEFHFTQKQSWCFDRRGDRRVHADVTVWTVGVSGGARCVLLLPSVDLIRNLSGNLNRHQVLEAVLVSVCREDWYWVHWSIQSVVRQTLPQKASPSLSHHPSTSTNYL